MVQRWIKAAGPDVYLATLSLGRTVPRAIGDAGRGRQRNSVSVTKGNNCHAVAPFPGQASGCKSTSLLSHPLSPAGRAVESHSPVDYGLVCFGFNASSLGQSPWEEQEKEEGFFFPHVMVTEYIPRALKSAHQTLGHLQKTPTFQRRPERTLPIVAG